MHEVVIWMLIASSGAPMGGYTYPDRSSCEQARMQYELVQNRQAARDRYDQRRHDQRRDYERRYGSARHQSQGPIYQGGGQGPYSQYQDHYQYGQTGPGVIHSHTQYQAYRQPVRYQCVRQRVMVNY